MQDDQAINTILRSLGRYQVLHRIGRGGMGEVWLCDDPRLRRQVAIKTLPPHNQDDREFSARFEREAQAAAALNHPHILPVHDYGEQRQPNGQIITYIVMPYVGGGSLADRIHALAANQEGMPQDEALAYLMQAAEAIDYAHSQGIIHRDVKPANMLLRSDKSLLLADFGIARILSSPDKLTQAGVGIGTPEYMAPEQAQGHAVEASDNYSLGVIAYELFTGRPPFRAETSYATIIQHLTLPPPPPRQFNPALSEACEQVLLRGLVKDPTGRRYASACQLVEELKRTFNKSILSPQLSSSQQLSNQEAQTPTIRNEDALPTLVDGDNKTASTAKTNPHRTRRNILIGGATALVAVGAGTGIWALATHQPIFSHPAAPPLRSQVPPTPTPDPNGPAFILRGHNQPAKSLAWWPTQSILYSASDDGTIKLWDVNLFQSQKQDQYTSTGSHNFKGLSKQLAWTADGQYLAIGNSRVSPLNQVNSTIDVYKSDLSNVVPGLENGINIPEQLIEGIGWYNGKYIVAAWYDVTAPNQFSVGLWNPFDTNQSFAPVAISSILSANADLAIQDLVVSRDGSQIAFCSGDGVLVGKLDVQGNTFKWNPASYSPLKNTTTQASYNNEVKTLAWTASGNGIIAIVEDGYPGNKILGWSLRDTPQDSFQFVTPSSSTYLTAVATYPTTDKPLFAAGSKDGSVYIWDTNQNNILSRTLHSGSITAEVLALAWSFDGNWLAASYNDTDASILVWKV